MATSIYNEFRHASMCVKVAYLKQVGYVTTSPALPVQVRGV